MFHLIEDLFGWLSTHWRYAAPLAGGLAAYCLLQMGDRRSRAAGIFVGIATLAIAWLLAVQSIGNAVIGFCFAAFAGLALGAAMAMIVQPNPVYSALHFALVILSTCGLFLLQAASFLAAATIIVYAGAIIVTFLFVIMLAHQSGRSAYDRQPRQPFLVGAAGAVILGAILGVLHDGLKNGSLEAQFRLSPAGTVAQQASKISTPSGDGRHGVRDLGRTLFTDYLWATELAGTVLLASTIGAIAIASHRKGVAA